ncbi:hypothetical protein, partial [Streptomyces sp. CNQ085]|uniref:hypothetical protein n=1 Tax=Streptomyces sp. CNQ085 TaxID=2886944 RepID=UPI0035B4EA1C|nr:hypothetical protein [Streptomyces sp. CNQ085]
MLAKTRLAGGDALIGGPAGRRRELTGGSGFGQTRRDAVPVAGLTAGLAAGLAAAAVFAGAGSAWSRSSLDVRSVVKRGSWVGPGAWSAGTVSSHSSGLSAGSTVGGG